jgi:hypothetical protein
MVDASWYVKTAAQVRGPVSFKTLQKAASAGKFKSGFLLRSGTEGPWIRPDEVDGLVLPLDERERDSLETGVPQIVAPASPAAMIVFVVIALVTAVSPSFMLATATIVVAVTAVLAICPSTFLKLVAGKSRLGQIWLTRELVRLETSQKMEPVFLVSLYAILTAGIALPIAVLGGTSGIINIMTAGGFAALSSGVLLTVLLGQRRGVEEKFSTRLEENSVLTRNNVTERNEKQEQATAERQRVAAERARQEAARREAAAVAESAEHSLTSPRPTSAGTCWYCRQSHRQTTQCPYCQMLA